MAAGPVQSTRRGAMSCPEGRSELGADAGGEAERRAMAKTLWNCARCSTLRSEPALSLPKGRLGAGLQVSNGKVRAEVSLRDLRPVRVRAHRSGSARCVLGTTTGCMLLAAYRNSAGGGAVGRPSPGCSLSSHLNVCLN
jgi:hypothetical protein